MKMKMKLSQKARRELDDLIFSINQELADSVYAWVQQNTPSTTRQYKEEWDPDAAKAKSIYKYVISQLRFEDIEEPR